MNNKKRTYVQHLAACTIRETLDQLTGNRPVELLAYDPDYCDQCAKVLKEFCIETTTEFKYSLEIDRDNCNKHLSKRPHYTKSL